MGKAVIAAKAVISPGKVDLNNTNRLIDNQLTLTHIFLAC